MSDNSDTENYNEEEGEEEEEEIGALECVLDLMSHRNIDDIEDLIFGAISMPPMELMESFNLVIDKLIEFTAVDTFPEHEEQRLRAETVVNLIEMNSGRIPELKNQQLDAFIDTLKEWAPFLKPHNESEVVQPTADLAVSFLMCVSKTDDPEMLRELIGVYEIYLLKGIPAIDKCLCNTVRYLIYIYGPDGYVPDECLTLVDAMIAEGRQIFYPVIEHVFDELPDLVSSRLGSIYNLYSLAACSEKKMKYLRMLASGAKYNPVDMLQFVDQLREDIPKDNGNFACEILKIFKCIVFEDMEFIFDCKEDMVTAIEMNADCKQPVKDIMQMLDWQSEELYHAVYYEKDDVEVSDVDDDVSLSTLFEKYCKAEGKKKRAYLTLYATNGKDNSFDVLEHIDDLRADIAKDDGKCADIIMQLLTFILYDDMDFVFECKPDMITAMELNPNAIKYVKQVVSMLEWENQELLQAISDCEELHKEILASLKSKTTDDDDNDG